jgi:(4S)-4-hydroxy-5-phosphonooxypentane-2,3-dione isomerase
MAYVLNVRMTAREGEEERAAELIGELAAATRQEPGNIQWVGHRSVDNPRTFMVYEQYRDAAAFEEHGQTEHFKAIALEQLFPLMEGERERNFYETLD